VRWLRRVINARSLQEMKGLVLDNPRWEVIGCTDPSRFFRALILLAPSDAIVMLEGGGHPTALRAFLEEQSTTADPRPALGTVWPAAPYFCVPARAEVLERLATLSQALPYREVCDHLHVFTGERVLLPGYDAFELPFYLAGDLPEDAVRSFCADAECSYRACEVGGAVEQAEATDEAQGGTRTAS
jgi:hypothetical protein